MPKRIAVILLFLSVVACHPVGQDVAKYTIYQTSAAGDQLRALEIPQTTAEVHIQLMPEETFQTIQGFGGAFTESTAWVLNQLPPQTRDSVIRAYFSNTGAAYSLCRTHMNSCDFSVQSYAYAPVAGDTALVHFSIQEDQDDLIPLIKRAQQLSEGGFKLVASPWTAPPWMKDNNAWFGGKLKPEYYDTWALFFSKYAKAYEKEGIPIWAFTVENEPLGNGNNWESMHYTPQEMASFVTHHLGPRLARDSIDSKILVYDQNRGEELEEWAEVLLTDQDLLGYIGGTAVHWYTSTFDWFPESLQRTHELAPEKEIIHTEGCIDAEVPHWQDDAWYWKKEATDWGYDWAPEADKPMHPKYVPAYRYARDIIGCLNNWVSGWIDWNMVLDDKGGPNHAENWCIAPVLAKPETGEVYFTPLYYILTHFSKFIQPGAKRIGFQNPDADIMLTAAQNPDGSIVVVLLNMTTSSKTIGLKHKAQDFTTVISPQAIQTIIIP